MQPVAQNFSIQVVNTNKSAGKQLCMDMLTSMHVGRQARMLGDAGRKNGQDARWLQQVRKSGTTSDKVAALTLLLQESAVANLRSLDALLNWVLKRKGGRNVVAQVLYYLQ